MPILPSTGSAKARVGYRSLAYVAGAECFNVDPAFPVSRMAELRYFQRSTKSVSSDAPVIHLDFGTDVVVAALSFEHVNFPTVSIQYGTNADPHPVGGRAFADETIDEAFPWATGIGWVDTSGVDSEDGRQKRLVIPPEPRTLRHLYLNPYESGRDDVYAIGSLGAWGADDFQSLYKNPGTPYRKVYEDTYDGSTSPTRCVISFPARLQRADLVSVEQFLAMLRAPRERVMLWDENEGDLSKWYHVRRAGVGESTRQAGPYLELAGFQLREVGSRADDA